MKRGYRVVFHNENGVIKANVYSDGERIGELRGIPQDTMGAVNGAFEIFMESYAMANGGRIALRAPGTPYIFNIK